MTNLSVRWRNFHGFRDTGEIDIKPITILLGANNSGKTSVFLPLLVLKQSLEQSSGEPALASRGLTVNAGGFRDLAHLGNEDCTIRFRLRLAPLAQRDDVDCDSPFHYPPGSIDVSFRKDELSDRPILQEYKLVNRVGESMVVRRRKKDGTYSIREMGFGTDSPRSHFDQVLRKKVRRTGPDSFLFNSFRPSAAASRETFSEEPEGTATGGEHSDAESGRDLSSSISNYLMAVDYSFVDVTRFLSTAHYLGPVRSPAQRYYELSASSPSSVGSDGSYAAEMLYLDGLEGGSLNVGVQEWLQRLGLEEQLSTDALGEGVFSLYFTPPNSEHRINYADMGFGLSQLMPLLVEAQKCEAGHTFLCEQPELHLNPKLQGAIADLFVDIASRGGKSVVETHSEHLLLRLRRLIAEGAINASDVALYYVEREGDKSSLREVPVAGNGHIDADSWPKDFFGDTLEESMALVRAQAARKRDVG